MSEDGGGGLPDASAVGERLNVWNCAGLVMRRRALALADQCPRRHRGQVARLALIGITLP
jgi:hypothetical protein